MQTESSNNSKKETFPKSLKIEKENNICKDGFCSLPNQTEVLSINNSNLNMFDPV
tara:strand:+ start:257 stop:421 length:165 start_codon:yes stop_codon:yes gene_type:complete